MDTPSRGGQPSQAPPKPQPKLAPSNDQTALSSGVAPPPDAPNLDATQAFQQTEVPAPAPASPNVTQAFQETHTDGGPGRPHSPAPLAGPHSERSSGKLSSLGDFKLVKKLGAGGMGEVYKGWQISLERDTAVKVMAKHLANNKNFVERFYREARLMAKLDHPHIIRSFGVGQEHGYHYLAMEFVDGGSLQDALKKHGKLSVGDSVHVILACARALEHAHGLSIIHRDIKPDNVLLTRQGLVKLADLGLAKATEEDMGLTQSGMGAGTPHYMAPEQTADAKHADARCDIYALGCMLYCLLTGKPPFQGDSTIALFKAKEAGTFPPARRSNQEVPEKLDLVIDKMIARKPEHRYSSCTELIKQLEGLGIASATLSFFGAEAKPSPVAGTSKVTQKPAAGAAPATAAKPKTEDEITWQVSYTKADGKQAIKKLTTTQIRALIQEPGFDVEAQARRSPTDTWRSLASMREFEGALRGRLAKATADQKAAKYHGLYEQIEEEQRRLDRWAKFKKIWNKMKDGLGFVFWMIVLASGLAIAFFVVKHFMNQ